MPRDSKPGARERWLLLPEPAGAAASVRTATGSGNGIPVRSDTWRASFMRPRDASQATDSGILKNANGSSVTMGSAPIQNRPRQPMCCNGRCEKHKESIPGRNPYIGRSTNRGETTAIDIDEVRAAGGRSWSKAFVRRDCGSH